MSHPKRPRDTNQLAKLMTDILNGQIEDREPTSEEQGKDPAATPMHEPALAGGALVGEGEGKLRQG
jgi:hypothetical protein